MRMLTVMLVLLVADLLALQQSVGPCWYVQHAIVFKRTWMFLFQRGSTYSHVFFCYPYYCVLLVERQYTVLVFCRD